jgi:hypothetical protein
MAMRKISFAIEERNANILESLSNRSKIVNNLLTLLFNNITENDLMKLSYALNNDESLRKEMQNILQRNMGIKVTAQTDKAKSNKAIKQTIKEPKEKEPVNKKPISFDSWW